MKSLVILALALCVGETTQAQDKALPRSTPEAQGIASSAILDFVKTADKTTDAMHSFMIVRHGQVVAEGWWNPYAPQTPHALYSLSKSFTSTAVGLAIAEGKMSLDDEVARAFPEDVPPDAGNNLKSMRVRDLLRMSTGHQAEPSIRTAEVWTKAFLAQPVPFKPGTHFVYNTPATYMLSAMVQKATGQTVLDYLRPRLFEPLGIENPTWETSPQGISTGGYGLSIRTEDIAKFGQLLLQKGQWHGKPIVPEGWVNEATSRQTSNGSNPKSDWDQGYGFQFWRCRNNAFRGDGAFGQFCVVMPDQDAVIAITSGTKDLQGVLNLVWDKLLPAMQDHALSPDDEALKTLKETIAALTIPVVADSGSPGKAAGKTFTFSENERKLQTVKILDDGDKDKLVLKIDGHEQTIVCGNGSWTKGSIAWGNLPAQTGAACGGWDGETYVARLCFTETPFVTTVRMTFDGDSVKVTTESNVGFGSTRPAPLVGKAE